MTPSCLTPSPQQGPCWPVPVSQWWEMERFISMCLLYCLHCKMPLSEDLPPHLGISWDRLGHELLSSTRDYDETSGGHGGDRGEDDGDVLTYCLLLLLLLFFWQVLHYQKIGVFLMLDVNLGWSCCTDVFHTFREGFVIRNTTKWGQGYALSKSIFQEQDTSNFHW